MTATELLESIPAKVSAGAAFLDSDKLGWVGRMPPDYNPEYEGWLDPDDDGYGDTEDGQYYAALWEAWTAVLSPPTPDVVR